MRYRFFALLICLLYICSFSCAFGMTQENALEIVMDRIPEAKEAVNIAVFPSSEYDGTFAVIMDKYNKDTSFNASFWYITPEDALLLGQGDHNRFFGLLPTNPEVFYNAHGPGNNRTVRACILIDNKPVEITNADNFVSLTFDGENTLIGIVSTQDNDYAFLLVDKTDPANPMFTQIRASELSIDDFLSYNGAKYIIDTIESSGYSVDSCLYWPNSAFALNCSRDSKPYHVYIYMIEGKLQMQGGWWGDEIGMLEGSASPIRNLDMPVIRTE